jgi:hypothetical protein
MAANTDSSKPRDTDTLITAGDVIINKVEMTLLSGETLDLRPFIVEINIYEDMYSPALTGNVVIRDAVNLIGKLPLVGDEVITIDVHTPTFSEPAKPDRINKIQKSFSVYSIKDRSLNSDREQFYTIHFCSLEASLDNVAKVSRKFEGNTDDIVLKIFEEYFKLPRIFNSKTALDSGEGTTADPTVEKESTGSETHTALYVADSPHKSKISFVSPMWSPMKIINWLAKRTIGNTYDKSPTFLFFETTKAFYYTSIEALVATQMTNGMIYTQFVYNIPTAQTRTEDALRRSFSVVKDVSFLTNLDVLRSQDLGHFTNSVYTFDLIKKEHKHWIYDHGMAFQDYKHMESYKIVDKKYVEDDTKKFNSIFPFNVMRSYNTKSFMSTINPGVLDYTEESVDLKPEKFIGQRNSLLMDINTLKMSIEVPGRTDCEVGKIVEFFYPNVDSKNSETTKEEDKTLWDPLISGFYLITALHHRITPFQHSMFLEISKDSYKNALLEVEGSSGDDTATTPTTTSSPTTTTSSPTTTSGNATPAAVGSKLFVFGDSIGVGIKSVGNAAGSARGGDSPRTVYNAITTFLKTNNVKGATILLSSGASNGAPFEIEGGKITPQREFEFIAKQISALKAAGASKVILLGTASGYSKWFPATRFTNNKKYRVDLRAVNNQLSRIASGNGAEFTGPLEQFDDLKNDGLHPYGGYSKIWKKYSGSK